MNNSELRLKLHDKKFADLTSHELYAILRLRNEVFVLEQDCVYLDLDNRDQPDSVRHIWLEHDRQVLAVCRLLDEGDRREIGRIVTAAAARGHGAAARLIDYCISATNGPWQLAAQAHLQDWYARFGFVAVGDRYDEDGIAHIKMIKPEPPRIGADATAG